MMSDFNPNVPFVWPFAAWQGTYTGPTDSPTLTADTLIDASMFANSIVGTNGTGKFSIVYNGNSQVIGGTTFVGSLEVVFTPVPEPGSMALTGMAVAAGLACWRRRRRAVRQLAAVERVDDSV